MTDGNDSPNVWPLECYRHYFELLVRTRLRRLPTILDTSDIVQDVFLKAYAHREQFKGNCELEWRAWLRRILFNELIDVARKYSREPKFVQAIEQSSIQYEALFAADHTSPIDRVDREDRLIQLANALAELLEAERTAVEMRYLTEPRFSRCQIAEHLGRSTKAVAGLLERGLDKIRDYFEK